MPIETARMDLRRKPKLSEEIKSLSDAEIEARAKADEDSPPLSGRELADLAPATPRPIRDSLGLTQDQFANLFNIPAATIRDWEQGRVRPDAAGRALLKLIAADPKSAASVFSDEAEVSEVAVLVADASLMLQRDAAVLTEQLLESIKTLHGVLATPEGFLRFGGHLAGTEPMAKKLTRAAKAPARRRVKTAPAARALDG